jgi:sn-glycerol 3-phosphate transport system ATP-binding protein
LTTDSPAFFLPGFMSDIRLDRVSKVWGPTRAVDQVSFSVREGAFTVLLGPSGSGKSTVLRLIAGLEEASEGRIVIAGKDVTNLPPSQRAIAMVFQSYALFPHLDVAENIVFGLKVRGVPAAERTERLKRTADLLGLSALLARKPSQLSGGQRQRVALGRAIVAETRICLMDEPMSNLDAQLRAEMRREIRALQQRLGMTMIYVTHDQTEAMTMADQIVLLKDGRIEQDAAPHEVYQSPATAFVARFIGTPPMNVLALSGSGGAVIAGSEGPQVLSGAGEGLLLGVRPEHVRLSDSFGVPASVLAAEYLGADTVVTCGIGSETIAARLDGRVPLQAGGVVRLAWPAEAIHLFDRATGRRHEGAAPAARMTQ